MPNGKINYTNMTQQEMISHLSPDQDKMVRNLSSQMKQMECFEYEGVLFKGRKVTAAIAFAYNNPKGGDFYVWLQDNFKILCPSLM